MCVVPASPIFGAGEDPVAPTRRSHDDARRAAQRQPWLPWILTAPVLLFLCIFFLGPLAFNVTESLKPSGGPLSLQNYMRVTTDPYFIEVALSTLMLGGGVTLICLLVGYPFAYAVARSSGGLKASLIFTLVAPLLVNVVVRSYGWMILIGGNGLLDSLCRALGLPTLNLMYTWSGIVIALVHVLLPFMVISIASTLESLDPRIEDAAAVHGASPLRTLLYVSLPLSIEGVITGSIMTFTLTIGSFVTVMLLGDNSTMVLPLLIYQRLTTVGDWGTAAALGIVLLATVMALLGMQSMLRRRSVRRVA
jgi:putative spermidine/putrescine transport system permease protein